MQNRLLSITRNIIPYVKELRPIAGSVTSVLLWQQLDYWFAKSPDSFYKFLSPPQTNHEKYRIGDSWTEEMGFSEKEFRNAFDKIGIRHTSKGAFNKTETPFIRNGKEVFFCSYHDKMKGITFYFRNHDLADKALDSLVKTEACPVTAQREVTEITKGKLQRLPKGSSTIYTETTPDNNNNKVVEEDDNFKKVFSPEERPVVQKVLATIPEKNQSEVLAVLFVMIKTTTIANKVGYLSSMVKRVTEGTFTPLLEKTSLKRQIKEKCILGVPKSKIDRLAKRGETYEEAASRININNL